MKNRKSAEAVQPLFEKNSFLREFTAKVVECKAAANGRFAVVLEQTAFFPEGGGQKSDTGFLDEIRVLDVQQRDGVIYHFIKEPLEIDRVVRGKIDWEQRFKRMQNHTGEHIVSGLVHKLYGYENVGFHLNDEEMTMDYNGFLEENALLEMERLANQAVAEDICIKAWYPEKPEAIAYRSKLELAENIRLVEIPGVDICACCAPHVARTGQVGLIKITQAQRYKGGVRLHAKCGFCALEDYQAKQACLFEISQRLSLPWAKAAQGVERALEKAAESERKYREATLLYLKERIAQKVPANGCVFLEDSSFLKEAAALAGETCTGLTGSFCGSEEEGYRYMIVSSVPLSREKAEEIKQALLARGGGDAYMLQGHAKAKRLDIEAYFSRENGCIKENET